MSRKMKWTMLFLILTLVFAVSLAMVACGGDDSGDSDDESDNDDDEDGDAADGDATDGDTLFPDFGDSSDSDDGDGVVIPDREDEFPTDTGNATADRMFAAAAECGLQTPTTVPAGWDIVPAGENGCSFWAPPGWQAIGAGTAVTAVQEDATGMTGFILMGGTPDLQARVECTPPGAANYIASGMEQLGCSNVETLYFDEYMEDIVDIQIPAADWIYSCNQSGETKVGYFWITIHGTTPLCNLLAIGLWMPESQIDEKMCTLTQIFNSIKCPTGSTGDCSDTACKNSCIENGGAGGYCDSEDNCICSD